MLLDQRPMIIPTWQAMFTDAVRVTATLAQARVDERVRSLSVHAEAVVAVDAVEFASAVVDAGDWLACLVPGYSFATGQWRRAAHSVLRGIERRLDVARAVGKAGRTRAGSAVSGYPTNTAVAAAPNDPFNPRRHNPNSPNYSKTKPYLPMPPALPNLDSPDNGSRTIPGDQARTAAEEA